LDAAQVGSAGSQVTWPQVDLAPVRDAQVEIITGSAAEAARILVDRLVTEKII
jgi:hypothetical protein